MGSTPAPNTHDTKHQHNQEEIAKGCDRGRESGPSAWDERTTATTTTTAPATAPATTLGCLYRGHRHVYGGWTRVGRTQGISAGKRHGESSRCAKHYAGRALLRCRAWTGAATKVPQECKREVILEITAGAREVDTVPRADGDVCRWVGNTTLWRIVDGDGPRRWRGISASCRI